VKRLPIGSLRKGGPLLEEAAAAWLQGVPLAFPSECGMFQLDSQGETWLSHQPPPLGEDPDVRAVAEVFWPGPLRLRLPHPEGKRAWQVPAHPLAQAILALLGPVRAHLRVDQPDQGMVLVWKEPPLQLAISEVDCACNPWRWLRTGAIERRELEWVAGRATLLSGPALPQLPMQASRVRDPQPWRIDP
jgi:hypothetical protein